MGILSDNPIIWREAVPRQLRRLNPFIALPALAATMLFSFIVGMALGESLAFGILAIWSGITLILAPVYTSRSIVSERLRGEAAS